MNSDVLRDLFKVIDYTAKKLFKTLEITIRYSILSILILIPLAINLLDLTKYSVMYLISILAGLIGSTILSTYIIIISHVLNKHLDLSKLHYVNLRDLFSNIIDRGELRNYYQFIEELLVVSKVNIEYTPVTLIPAYTALLFIEEKLYFTSFLTIYLVLCTAMFYETVSKFNNHVVCENKIEREVFNFIESSDFREFNLFQLRKIDILLSIITFSVYLTYLLYKSDTVFSEHVKTHRVNYQELAKYVVNKLRI